MNMSIVAEGIDSIAAPLFRVDRSGRLVYANRSLFEFMGLSLEGVSGRLGQLQLGLHHLWTEICGIEQAVVHRANLCTADGRQLATEWLSQPIRDARGDIAHVEAVLCGSPACAAAAAQTPSAACATGGSLLQMAVEQAADHIAVLDFSGRVLYVNDAFARLTGADRSEIIGQPLSSVWDDLVTPIPIEQIRRTLRQGRIFRGECVNRRASGSLFFDEVSVSALRDADGDIRGCVLVGRDVTARYLTDPLTGLSTRRMLVERIIQVLRRSHREPERICAVLFVDVDRFKAINDSYGFEMGDSIIVELSRRIQSSVREVDFVAHVGRLHRDEFSVLLEGLREAADARRVVERIQARVCEPIAIGQRQIVVTVSTGIAIVDPKYDSADDVLRDAETAMMEVKRNGGASCHFFDPTLHEAVVRKLNLANDLRRAIDDEELVLHYQPVVSLRTGRITGLEALVRWQHPSLGFLSPLEFISIAEENGLIVPLGNWVLCTACQQLKLWQHKGYDGLSMSVNVSPRQFRDEGFVRQVNAAVSQSQIEPQRLKLEVTETTAADDPNGAIGILTQLKRRGVEIMLDDFGTGYSSLNFLTRFPLDKLKIDRSFVRHVPGSAHDEAVATTIVAMGKSLGFGLIAEGVETSEQLAFLHAIGCEEIQGFLFSPPVQAGEVEAMLANGRSLRV